MQEEVFGPILPVLEIESVDWTNRKPHPLGLYIFAEDHDVVNRILDATESGDAVVKAAGQAPHAPGEDRGAGREAVYPMGLAGRVRYRCHHPPDRDDATVSVRRFPPF